MTANRSPNSWRHVGLGLEYAGAILLLGLLGHWWFDDDQGTPWGLLVGALIGFTGATYNLIKIALKANRDTKD